MTKIYFFIGIGLVSIWILTWFGVKSMYKSLDQGEAGKFVKMFIPKDFQRDLEMIEMQARRKQREQERKNAANENASENEFTENDGGETAPEKEEE